ncbi:MAG TPA: helix-turn-helix transcriptional regulator [Ktedonobacterales bacterium]|nr:helix-turn-helix transcriptional regulator [Ktedonobacterales bacterium]
MTEGKRGAQVKYLRQWRRHRLLTQSELADKAGVTKGTIIRIEAGGYMNYGNIRAIAEALDTTPQQLLAGPPDGYVEAAGAA